MRSIRTALAWLPVAAITALNTGCSSLEAPTVGNRTTAARPKPAGTAPVLAYEIGPEDLLEIVVWKEEGLKKEVVVRPDGGISFPLIGEVHAGGKTPQQLLEEITLKLARFIPRASVNVSVLKAASYKIYVIGRVNKPGEFTSGRQVDVLQALSMAGGLTPFAAAQDILVLRKVNGKDTRFSFDYSQVQGGIGLSQNIPLKSGDTVVVP